MERLNVRNAQAACFQTGNPLKKNLEKKTLDFAESCSHFFFFGWGLARDPEMPTQ